MSAPVLDLTAPRPSGLLAVDASAGTGKTYALVALAVRAVAVGEVTADRLLLVTFTRAAAAELRDRLRTGLVAAAAGLAPDAAPGSDAAVPVDAWVAALAAVPDAERAERAGRVRTALTAFDRATVTTLHGFCQTALGLAGLRTGTPPPRLVADTRPIARSALRDRLLARLLDPAAPPLAGDGAPDTVEGRLAAVLRAVLAAAGARPAPLGAADPPTAEATAAFVAGAVAEFRRRLRADGASGFDDLVLDLHARLHAPGGDEVAAALRRQFRLVLVDEHQDTDAVQWAVLRRAFRADVGPAAPASDLVFVGDPKQSIYRFRGADVGAYLAARDEVDAIRVLDESHRAAPDLVAALNVLLRGVDLGDGIAFTPVAAARGPVAGARGAALELRWLAPGPDGYPAEWEGKGANLLLAPPTTGPVLADLVARVADVLTEPLVPTADGGLRPPSPSEVAVLVRTNPQAAAVVTALEAAGIPAARPRGGSVYDADAVVELRLLLAALADPTDERRVRAVRTSWFVGADPGGADDPAGLVALQARLDGWADELAARGMLALWARLRAEPDAGAALAAAGERGTTDLEHLAELVHVALGARGAPPAVALRALDELRLTRPLDEDAGEDPAVRRLPSDGAAVQVMTVHRAKGLEWPVVLLPFGGFDVRNAAPYAFASAAGRIVDAASGVAWHPVGADPEHPDRPHADPAGRREAARAELAGDLGRLLYVAVTRARERLVLWWVPTPTSRGSELHRVLFGARDPDGTLRPGPPPKLGELSPAATAAALGALADRVRAAGGTAATVAVPPDAIGVRRGTAAHTGSDPAAEPGAAGGTPPLAVARLERNVTTADVGRWSYTRLMDTGHAAATTGHAAVPGPDDTAGPAPEEEGGGRDEPPTPLQEVAAGGTAFGVVVHRALETVDPAGPDLEARLRSHLAADPAARVAGDPAVLAAALARALATPLDPLLPGVALGAVPASDRVAELRFDLPLGDTVHRIDLDRFGTAVAAELGDDPLAASFAELGARVARPRIAGWLTGSLDLLVRTRDADGRPRFTVIDHKTNVLRGPDGDPAYGPEAMRRAVLAGEYAVQMLLYLVAAHRFLRWRQPGYDPARDLAGAGLLFLRGLGGPGAPLRDGGRDGVFAWRPPLGAVLRADRLLAEGPA